MKHAEDIGLAVGLALAVLAIAVVLLVLAAPQVRNGGNPVPCDDPRPAVCPQR